MLSSKLSSIILLFLISVQNSYTAVLPTECSLKSSGVYVSISSEGEVIEGIISRWIELHWWGKDDLQPGDAVGLWNHDPLLDSTNPLYLEMCSNSSDDFVRTNIRWNNTAIPTDLSDLPECLPLWVGFIRDEVLESSCLELHPRWMEEHIEDIGDVGLADVILPGTHDAGAYGLLNDGLLNDVDKWSITQDETFLHQLILGVRYLDIRIGYYPDTEEKLFIVHGSISIRPLQSYLDDVALFVASTNEIVIFDIHSLEHGFSGTSYDENAMPALIQALETSFNGLMLPNSFAPNPKLSEIWETGQHLIVTFPDTSASPRFWERVQHIWGNVNSLEDLYDYMTINIPMHADSDMMSSAMAEFTPTAVDVTLDRWGGLRGAAAETNFPVTLWLRREWWINVNIIAMDFVLSSDVIKTVIEGNVAKSQCVLRND